MAGIMTTFWLLTMTVLEVHEVYSIGAARHVQGTLYK